MTASKLLCSASIVLLSILYLSNAQLVEAQGTLQVSGTASLVTKTGQEELVGPVTFTVSSGTTKSGTITLNYGGIPFTNTAATGITLDGVGGLAGSTIAAVVPDSGVVIINIPAGAAAGSALTLSGIRFSAFNSNFTTLNAQVSTTENFVVAGQTNVQVVRGVVEGLQVDIIGGPTFTFLNSQILGGPAFIVREGWPAGFSGAVGVLGQTAKTQIIFQLTGLPDNVTVRFPALVTTTSGATLTTASGPVVVTNQSASSRVVYEFTDSATSPLVIDDFTITPAIDFVGTPGNGTTLLQVALGPIGAAVPNVQFPSTDIPRFAENFLPPAAGFLPGPTISLLPVPSSIDDETVVITNTSSGGAVVTARARREDGTLAADAGIQSEVTFDLPARQARISSLKQIFGTAAVPSRVASVEVESANNLLIVKGIASVGTSRFAVQIGSTSTQTYVPFDRRTSADIPLLTVQNPGNSNSSVDIAVRNSAGVTIAVASRSVASHGAVRESFSTLFSGAAVPLEGYLRITAPSALRTTLLNNPTDRPDEIPTLRSLGSPSSTVPYFVFGGGYNTALMLLNADARPVTVTLNAYSPAGVALTSQPVVRQIPSNTRSNLDFNSLFATPASITQPVTGYLSLAFDAPAASPFSSPPAMLGLMRISAPAGIVAALPGDVDTGTEFFITPTSETASNFTGLAIMNPTAASVAVTVEVFSSAGAALGTTTFTLGVGTSKVQLLRELIPTAFGHDNGLVRVSCATGVVKVVGFRGSLGLTELINLGADKVP